MAGLLRIVERDEGGRVHSSEHGNGNGGNVLQRRAPSNPLPAHVRLVDFAAKVFLPAGYPASVSPDYLRYAPTSPPPLPKFMPAYRYQIFNALQAFCSALAGLLSSRALLEVFGVGDANASATHALLLSVLQDFFGRVTTICAAYALGSALAPEAKTFRLLADVANDGAIVLDTLTPLLLAQLPGARVAALCLSGALRALCAIAAGGSKAALTMHFATPVKGTGDIGDLNAKDGSKETVLALLGMLAGSLLLPHLTTTWSTHAALFALVGLHLALNYVGIRGVIMRTLNRQRMTIAWDLYRESGDTEVAPPLEVARSERIITWSPGALRELRTDSVAGRCTVGSALSAVLGPSGAIPVPLLEQMRGERYVLWFDRASLVAPDVCAGQLHLHICLREGYASVDQFKAWAHAVEVGRMVLLQRRRTTPGLDPPPTPAELVLAAYRRVDERFAAFLRGMGDKGWNTAEAALLAGVPRALIVSLDASVTDDGDQGVVSEEARKDR
ncbi:vitamin B6 photo-protection and homoeostasis-domain-containing protein [Mycena pura]|uniref:Vitamin B6 photo-protection and homoeostasis-domain-containing protein n=1 Tax=Mycena pura TaxID=153505 RepID=A0AAD6Y4Q3_9AGAR|nr:vitamin B6 photo-protection and homoeostasis-domain-containing protein [Mycena pura]